MDLGFGDLRVRVEEFGFRVYCFTGLGFWDLRIVPKVFFGCGGEPQNCFWAQDLCLAP